MNFRTFLLCTFFLGLIDSYPLQSLAQSDTSEPFDSNQKRRSGSFQKLQLRERTKKKLYINIKRKETEREKAERLAREAAKKQQKKALSSKGIGLQQAIDKEQATLRMQKIKAYKRLIPQISEDSGELRQRKAEMYYQLAEEYWEHSKYLRFISLEKHNKELDAWDKECRKLGNASKCSPSPKPDLLQANAYRNQAITIYRRLLQKFPKYTRADEVIFYLGLNLMETQKYEEGIGSLQKLVKEQPKSRFIPDAYTSLGEYYFNKNKVQEAMDSYTKAFESSKELEKRTTSDDLKVSMRGISLRSTYMLAWCFFNVGENEKALNNFKQVIQLSRRYQKTKESKVLLKEESLRDLIQLFSKMDVTKEAYDYFKQIEGPKYAYSAGGKLAKRYYTQSNYLRAIAMYRLLMKTNEQGENDNLGPDVPVFQNEIVRSATGIWNPTQIYQEVLNMMTYFKTDHPWSKRWGNQKDVYQRAKDSAEQSLLEYSTKYHQLAQKEKKPEKQEQFYNFAIQLYQQYIRHFETDSAYELRFYLAELLYRKAQQFSSGKKLSETAQKHFAEAAYHYQTVGKNKQGQFLKQALFSEILCYETLAGRKGGAELRGAGKRLDVQKTQDGRAIWTQKTIEKNSWDERLLLAYQRYLQIATDKEDRLQSFFKTGAIYYSYKHYIKSMDIFFRMAKEFPGHELSRKAAFMILYSYEDLNEWEKLEKSARLFIENPQLTRNVNFKNEMYNMLIRSTYLHAWQDMKSKKTPILHSAERFYRYEQEFGKTGPWIKKGFKESPKASSALADAGGFYSKGKRILRAIQVRERLVKIYPDTPFTKQIIYELGGHYEQIADYQTAAKWFEHYAFNGQDYMASALSSLGDGTPSSEKPLPPRKRGKVRARQNKPSKSQPKKSFSFNDPEKVKTQKSNALYKAAAYRRGLEESDRAIALYRYFIKFFNDSKDLSEVYLAIATIHEEKSRWKDANLVHEEFLSKYQSNKIGQFLAKAVKSLSKTLDEKGEGLILRELGKTSFQRAELDSDKLLYVHARIAHSHRQLKEIKLMEERYMMINALGEKMLKAGLPFIQGNTTERSAFAEAKFFLAERRRRAYISLEIAGGQAKQGKMLKKIIEAGKKLTAEYGNVAKLGIPKWVIAAVFRRGEIYHLFVKKLYAAPMPKDLPQRLWPEYKSRLENIALQWEEQALDAYAGVLKKSAELGLYNEWARMCEDAQNELTKKKNRINPHTILSQRRAHYSLVEPSLTSVRLSRSKLKTPKTSKTLTPKKLQKKTAKALQ